MQQHNHSTLNIQHGTHEIVNYNLIAYCFFAKTLEFFFFLF